MGTMITCHPLAGNTTALKTCLSNVLSKTLPYGTTFGSVCAFILEKSSKNMQTYIHIYKHDLSPFSVHCMTPALRLRRPASV